MDDLDLGATIKGFSTGQKVFSRYTLRKQLGRGGMGVVWLAQDEELGSEIALKFLPEVVATDRAAIEDMKREVRRAINLAHPHIVKIQHFLTDGRLAAVAMEYVHGDTLSSLRLDESGHVFSPERLAGWVQQLCDALDYAHAKAKVVHRDLKPANLMVDAQGDLKILDFGIAASLSESVTRVSKQAGSSGTPVYMSPQQMMGEKPSVTDDIYALGATLYELLTGKPPFYAGNVFMQVQNKVPPSLADRRQELEVAGDAIPPEWEETVAACLAKVPSDRPQSAGEVAERLGLTTKDTKSTKPRTENGRRKIAPKVEPGHSPSVGYGGASRAAGERVETPRSTSKTRLYAGVAAAVLVLGGFGWYFGLHIPEQNRLAEIARLESEKKVEEANRLRTEQERAAAEAKVREEQIAAAAKAKLEQERLAAEKLAAARGGLVVRTTPTGAEVRVGAIALEKSPLTLKEQKLGKYPVRVRLDGYEEWTGDVEVKENEFVDLDVALVRSMGTVAFTSDPAGLEAEIVPLGQSFGSPGAQKVRTPATLKLPTGAYDLFFRRPGWPEQKQKVEVMRNQTLTVTGDFAPGGLELTSAPAGAEVWQDGRRIAATTPYRVSEIIPARYDFELRLKGFKPAATSVTVTARQIAREHATLEKQPFPQPGLPWENSLGQRFVPVPGIGVLFCIWETRVQDFEAFVRETGHNATEGMNSNRGDGWKKQGDSWKSPGYPQGPTHPVVGMIPDDAVAFCRWLTDKERRDGRLLADQEYRLPTDSEWDAAVGNDEFPWGGQWPPPRGAGNYLDEAAKRGRFKSLEIISGYDDGYDVAAPVGSFTANRYGIFDLGGNVWERVGDRIDGVRGASFNDFTTGRNRLTSVGRVPASGRADGIGFRVVVVLGSSSR